MRKEERLLTTFITQWGQYRYKTCPQGYAASQDGHTRRFNDIVNDFPNKTKCIDNICLWADTLEESFFRTCRWLDNCDRHAIVQNPEKFVFGSDAVEFAGCVITPTNIQPSDKHIRAIRDFSTQQNITDIRSLFGLINQVSYCDSLRNHMAPFRKHLKPSSTFYWDDQLQQVFEQSKAAILYKITKGVGIFDPKRVTCLATGWFKKSIGFWLLLKYCTCEVITPICCSTGWNIVFAGGRFIHPAESRYAPTEGEALAVVYGLESARHFVLGCDNLVLATDHKPLLEVLNNRHLGDIKNRRLLSLKEKTLPYRFSKIHIPGQNQTAPHVHSRKPTDDGKKLALHSDFEKSVSIACIEPRLCLPEATITGEPDVSADLGEKLAVA